MGSVHLWGCVSTWGQSWLVGYEYTKSLNIELKSAHGLHALNLINQGFNMHSLAVFSASTTSRPATCPAIIPLAGPSLSSALTASNCLPQLSVFSYTHGQVPGSHLSTTPNLSSTSTVKVKKGVIQFAMKESEVFLKL